MKQHIVYHLDANDIQAALKAWAANRTPTLLPGHDGDIYGVRVDRKDLQTACMDYVRDKQKVGSAVLQCDAVHATSAEVIVK